MVPLDEDESSPCSGLSGHDRLCLNGANMYELVDSKVLRTLFK